MYIASLHTRTGFVLGILSVSVCLSRCAPPVESKYDEEEFHRSRFAFKSSNWREFPSHDYQDYHKVSDTTIIILVVVLAFGFQIFLILCTCLLCPRDSRRNFVGTDTIVHPPPRNFSNMPGNRREPTGIHWSAGNGGENRVSFINLLAEMPSDAGRDPFTESNGILPRFTAIFRSSDKPPAYEAVITSDLAEQATRFPTVTPERQTEIPPPEYKEGTSPKY